jgi:hypothetical protein
MVENAATADSAVVAFASLRVMAGERCVLMLIDSTPKRKRDATNFERPLHTAENVGVS